MTMVEQLAAFVKNASYDSLSPQAVEQLKIRVLDSLGCAIGALNGEPVRAIRKMLADLEHSSLCTLIGGGKAAPDRTAFYNGALVRYLDFNDSYLAKRETCHPSDNLGAIMATAEYAGRSGRDLLTALAVAYQVQCRLSDVAPVRAKGFDHTTQGSYAAAASAAKALNLPEDKIAHAIAISGTALNALRVTRTGSLSHWKGLAYPHTAFGATHATLLASYGITGPSQVFEGNKGFIESIAGPFELYWEQENLEKVQQTIIKKYNAEIHSQSTLEGVLELREQHRINPQEITDIDILTFDVAYNIIGGGEEGEKKTIRTKEEADHSLPYMVAVALLDGQVMPPQYARDRIRQEDVQTLMQKINVQPSREFSRRFPNEMPCRVTLHLKNRELLAIEKSDYEGFFTRPMSFDAITKKFDSLTVGALDEDLRQNLLDAVRHLESIPMRDLTHLLSRVRIVAPQATVA